MWRKGAERKNLILCIDFVTVAEQTSWHAMKKSLLPHSRCSDEVSGIHDLIINATNEQGLWRRVTEYLQEAHHTDMYVNECC